MALFTQTTTFVNGQTADGGQVNTEVVNLGTSVNNITNAQIDAAAAIAISKTALGTYTDWTAYVVSLTALGGTLTNGATTTNIARWMQLGKQGSLRLSVTVPITGGTGNWAEFSLPFTLKDVYHAGGANIYAGGQQNGAVWVASDTTHIQFYYFNASNFTGTLRFDLTISGIEIA
jgi:hypothetical protein